ncbi:IS1595 family transposase [Xanthobacter pseudotagetidis]|uniref:IS1595 family transposase n=1 Tax=Xanthobacter pseudotagetidis TaxID=3119911 RepID=UPI003728A505
MSADLSNPIFQDVDKARAYLEAQRWPNGPTCPHCGNADPDAIRALKGKAHRPGVYQCNACREQFTVTVGTVFERSKIPLNKWLLATHLMCSSKKGISAHQLHRMLGITYKTAWFMAHRIREAMREDVATAGPLGGEGKVVEADETYFGKTDIQPKTRTSGKPFSKGGRRGPTGKRAVVGLVERGGKVRTFHVEKATKESVREILVQNASRKSTLHTDESKLYVETGKEFDAHHSVRHSAGEYARGDVHSNTIEGVFSVFKRGMRGVYQHCGEAHLHRYLTEFDFRYNRRTALGMSDRERTDDALKGIEGKRLTYRRIGEASIC